MSHRSSTSTSTCTATCAGTPKVADRLARAAAERDEFFVSILDTGVATGEVRPDDREGLVEFIRIMLIGLTERTTHGAARHRCAIDAIRSLLRGEPLRTQRT